MDRRLDYKKTLLIGFGFFGISVMWTLYNAYVPIYLQAGSPTFDAPREGGFGLGAGMTGVVMTLDNIAAFFLLPLIGVWSDRTWTRFGRRMPFILTLAPIAIVAFVLIPAAVAMIPPKFSGQVDRLGTPLALFSVAVGVFLLAIGRTINVRGRLSHARDRPHARPDAQPAALPGERHHQPDGRRRHTDRHAGQRLSVQRRPRPSLHLWSMRRWSAAAAVAANPRIDGDSGTHAAVPSRRAAGCGRASGGSRGCRWAATGTTRRPGPRAACAP